MPPVDPGRGMSIAGMVLGIIGLAFCWLSTLFFPIACAIVGLILSVIGMRKSKEAGFPTGMATAGLVCSVVSLGINASCIICYLGAVATTAATFGIC